MARNKAAEPSMADAETRRAIAPWIALSKQDRRRIYDGIPDRAPGALAVWVLLLEEANTRGTTRFELARPALATRAFLSPRMVGYYLADLARLEMLQYRTGAVRRDGRMPPTAFELFPAVDPTGHRKCIARGQYVTGSAQGNPLPASHNNQAGTTTDAASPGEEDDLPFRSDRFRDAWAEWKSYRKERRDPITPTTRRRQLQTLGGLGEEAAVRSIERSMANGWKGLFPPGPSRQQPGPSEPSILERAFGPAGTAE